MVTNSISIPLIASWLDQEAGIQSAVVFGSSAKHESETADADEWSDLDLHLVATDAAALERIDWKIAFPNFELCLQVVRPATGGVRKITVIFAHGQIDLVVVSARDMRFAAFALRWGLQRRLRFLDVALNEMATCLHSGYRFLKGQEKWGAFYSRVVTLPGVRVTDADLCKMADVFVCELLWVLQKIERGELVAAQHALHTKLNEANLRLWREQRRRKGLPLPSFGLGRRVEILAPPEEIRWLRINARPEKAELDAAAWSSFEGLMAIMANLNAAWSVSPPIRRLLERCRR